jgi:hypothetical protein
VYPWLGLILQLRTDTVTLRSRNMATGVTRFRAKAHSRAMFCIRLGLWLVLQ